MTDLRAGNARVVVGVKIEDLSLILMVSCDTRCTSMATTNPEPASVAFNNLRQILAPPLTHSSKHLINRDGIDHHKTENHQCKHSTNHYKLERLRQRIIILHLPRVTLSRPVS